MSGLDLVAVRALLQMTLEEDLGARGDVTSLACVPASAQLDVAFISRQDGVVAGLPVLSALVAEVGLPASSLSLVASDGARVSPGTVLATLSAPARSVLAMERTALNLLGHLCGVATATRAWVDAIEGTGARVRDTRKTMPLLRSLEKYAVRCGGGTNHRAGLDDAVLIKDNHVAAAGGVGAALDAAYAAYPRGSMVVQVEVDSLAQLEEALAHGAEQVLLDNFGVDQLARAVALVRRTTEGVVLEASGGLTLASARQYAETGVNYLAVGALTHSAPSLDIGLDVLVP